MSHLIADRTVGQIVAPDGSPAYRPTTQLSADAAAIMRHYFSWAMANGLEPELFCATCYDGTRDSKAVFQITDQEIEIVCRCQLRVFFGGSLQGDPIAPSVTVPTTDQVGPAEMRLSSGAAYVLRLYKRVLEELGMREALRCNTCYELDQEDGCEASVLTQTIRIRCRCSNRTFHGLTV